MGAEFFKPTTYEAHKRVHLAARARYDAACADYNNAVEALRDTPLFTPERERAEQRATEALAARAQAGDDLVAAREESRRLRNLPQ